MAPERDIIMQKKIRLAESRMTARLKQASSTNLRLYKNMLKPNSTDYDLNTYKAFRNKYNRLKHHAMLTYDHEKGNAYKSNVKKAVAIN